MFSSASHGAALGAPLKPPTQAVVGEDRVELLPFLELGDLHDFAGAFGLVPVSGGVPL